MYNSMNHLLPALPSYSELVNTLTQAKINFTPSEAHGLLCGYLCAPSGANKTPWKKTLLGKNKNNACYELLQQIYEVSYHQMSDFSFEFSLILPDDEEDINIRTEALGLWCQGFLTGLEQSKIPIQRPEDNEFTETLNNLIEIAQVSYGDIADNEEDETAYFELVEYVRLGALMIFQELKTPKAL